MQEEVLWLVMRDIAQGLQLLHDAGCLHLDIKPANIFAHRHHGGSITWRIGDFGLAVLKQQWVRCSGCDWRHISGGT